MREDQKFIKRCFTLARRGKGRVSPNPLVGAVLVKNGRVIGEGWHQQAGKAHAEVKAFENASEDVSGATLYCNLEPCCHTAKRTPPCTPLIIKKGIRRVVVSNIDPNPEVSGRGLATLEAAGIEVLPGVLAEQGEMLNKFFFKAVQSRRPYITVKIAQTLDGFITGQTGRRMQITGSEAQKYVHQLRAEYDAVLVGAQTVAVDNPDLTVRAASGRSPLRIILDGALSSPGDARVYTDTQAARTWLVTSSRNGPSQRNRYTAGGVHTVGLSSEGPAKLNLHSVMEYLYEQNIISLLVEGGQQIFSQFIREGLFDELNYIVAPKIFGGGLPALNGVVSENLQVRAVKPLGEDVLIILAKKQGALI